MGSLLRRYRRFSAKTLIVLAVVSLVVSALAGIGAAVTKRFIDPNEDVGSTNSNSAPQQASYDSENQGAPSAVNARGCLSNSSEASQHLLDTQARATPDRIGAAEFAGAWIRWAQTLPVQNVDEVLNRTTSSPDSLRPILGKTGRTVATLQGGAYRTWTTTEGFAFVDVAIKWRNLEAGGQGFLVYGSLSLTYREGKWIVDKLTKPSGDFETFTAGMSSYLEGC